MSDGLDLGPKLQSRPAPTPQPLLPKAELLALIEQYAAADETCPVERDTLLDRIDAALMGLYGRAALAEPITTAPVPAGEVA